MIKEIKSIFFFICELDFLDILKMLVCLCLYFVDFIRNFIKKKNYLL